MTSRGKENVTKTNKKAVLIQLHLEKVCFLLYFSLEPFYGESILIFCGKISDTTTLGYH